MIYQPTLLCLTPGAIGMIATFWEFVHSTSGIAVSETGCCCCSVPSILGLADLWANLLRGWLTKCIILCCQLPYRLFLRSREDEQWVEQEELEDHPYRPGASLGPLLWWHSIWCASVDVEHLDQLLLKAYDHQIAFWLQWASLIECCWKESFDLDL